MNNRRRQLSLSFPHQSRYRFEDCPHFAGFTTHAYVPRGHVCTGCGMLLFQYRPQPPEEIGYLSADWAWHHRDGRAWTTKEWPEDLQ